MKTGSMKTHAAIGSHLISVLKGEIPLPITSSPSSPRGRGD